MAATSHEDHTGLAIYRLSKLGQSAARVAEATLTPFGLRPREFSALALIDGLGAAAQSDVADGLGIDRSDMVTIVDKLERLALVTRSPDARDRRRHSVAATAKGAALVTRGGAALAEADAEFLSGLPKSGQGQLRKLLGDLGPAPDRR